MRTKKNYLLYALLVAVCMIFSQRVDAQVSCPTKFTPTTTILKTAVPEDMGMNSTKLGMVDTIINESIKNGEIPGAVIAVVRDGKMVYKKAYGYKQVYPTKVPMTENTIFDLASCSKSVGMALSFMHLLERGGFRLTDNVDRYIPNFQPYVDPKTGEKTDIRIIDLLTHSSGLSPYVQPGVVIKSKGKADPDSLMSYISTMKRDFKPTTKFQYSCLNFITLQNILQRITGMRLEDYAQDYIFDPMGLTSTCYNPLKRKGKDYIERIAPTEKQPDGSVLRGSVHDPLARVMNHGNSGNAGVFSSVDDLAVIAAALMNDGVYEGRELLGKLTVETMTRVPYQTESLGRSLGWDNYSPYASNNGNLFHPSRTFGHTGYTGTSIVIDPVSKCAVILLTHRVHPEDKGGVVRLRALVSNIVAASIVR